MNLRYIIPFILVMFNCSCNQQISKTNAQAQSQVNQQLDKNLALRIENDPIQSLAYTNLSGIEYAHAYSANTIYNDSADTVHLQIDISKEYHFPAPYNDKKYKVVTWPLELEPSKVTSQDSLSTDLQNFLKNGTDTLEKINITIAPHGKVVLTTGTLFDKTSMCYVSPNVLYVHNEASKLGDCENLITQDQLINNSMKLGLMLTMPMPINACTIISCGQISYAEK